MFFNGALNSERNGGTVLLLLTIIFLFHLSARFSADLLDPSAIVDLLSLGSSSSMNDDGDEDNDDDDEDDDGDEVGRFVTELLFIFVC